MKLKTFEHEGKTYAVLDDKGLPVYVHDDGKEIGFDAVSAASKITALNAEAKGHREAKEAAEAKLKGFEGIDDAEAAKKALETVANLDQGQLVTAGKVEEIKAAAKRAAEEQVAAAVAAAKEEITKITGERDTFKTQLEGELVGGGFSRSKFISEKIAIPADLMQAQFGRNFKVEDGKIVAYGPDGAKIYSRERPGELATMDEALQALVDAYPNRDAILKGGVGAGGGAVNGGLVNGKRTITRTEFAKLDPAAQAKAAGEMAVIDG